MIKKLHLKSWLLLLCMIVGAGTAWADDYNVTYNYGDLNKMLLGNYADANSYWKVPATAGNTATIAIPITNQPTSDITITLNIATFGSGENPGSTNTTITAVGTETESNWSGSGVSSYPSSSTYVDGVMTITKPSDPTKLSGLTITMGVNSGVKIFRLKSVTISYTYSSGTPTVATPTFSPAAGTYTSAQNVTISSETEGATIYYTTNGDTPTTDSNVYSSAINVSETTTIKAIAVKNGLENSTVASATYTIVNLDHAGTAEDPYSVADARAAIDANTGLEGVYATGIVSAIPTAWSTEHNNITFNFVDNSGDEVFLQAYRCASGDGADASTVAVGDIVVVFGNLTKYGSTYEFGQGCTLVSLTHSTKPTITVSPTSLADFTYEEEGGPSATKTISVSGANLTEAINLVLDDNSNFEMSLTEGSGYANNLTLSPEDGSVASTTVYVRLKDGLEIGEYTGTITLSSKGAANVTVNLSGSVTAPEAQNVTWDLSKDETATATVSEMTWTSDYATMGVYKGSASTNTNNYYPGTSGQSYTSTRFYKNSNLTITPAVGYKITSVVFTATTEGYANAFESSTWTNATTEALGTTVTITPTDGKDAISATIGGTCGFTAVKVFYEADSSPAISVDRTSIDATYEETSGTLPVAYANVDKSTADLFFCNANGEAATYDWIEADFDNAKNVTYLIEGNTGDARTAYMKVHGLDAEENDVYSDLITITQAAYIAPITGDKYVKVTSTSDLTNGQYLIVYEEGSVAFNGGLETLDAVGNTIEVTLNNNEIAAKAETAAAEFTIDVTAGTLKSASGYYIGQTSDANGMATSTSEAYTNTISIDGDGNATILSSGGAYLRYNFASNQTRFRYYKSASYTDQKAIQLYKKVDATPVITLSDVNSDDLPEAANNANVTLTRKFVNKWNPICLPFDVTDLSVFGEENEVVKYTGDADNNGKVSLKFETVTEMYANVPYMVWVNEKADVSEPWVLTFNGVNYNPSNNPVSAGTNYNYVGVYKNYAKGTSPIVPGDVILSGGAYKTVTGNGRNAIKGFRGYWKKSATAGEAKSITAIINGQETDDIKYIELVETLTDGIYNLQGQKVNHAQKGVYIVNGKKVVIK